METDSDEKQLLNQILNAVKVTPSLHEDLQVEVMMVGVGTTRLPAGSPQAGSQWSLPHSSWWECPLEEGIAMHSVFLPGKSPRTEEPQGLQSMGLQIGRAHV